MDFEAIRSFALSLPHATEDIKWEADLAFCIGSKMFLVGSLVDSSAVTLKVKDEEFEQLLELPGIAPAPYLGRYKWISVNDLGIWSKGEWESYIRQAYELVKAKLPARVRKALAEATHP